MYLDILRNNLKQSAEKMNIFNKFMLYKDNDSKHKAYAVREWLLYNCPGVIDTLPQSPDLNPIEMIWNKIDIQIHKHNITNKNVLEAALKSEWDFVDINYIKKLTKRLAEVIEQKSYSTKY